MKAKRQLDPKRKKVRKVVVSLYGIAWKIASKSNKPREDYFLGGELAGIGFRRLGFEIVT